MTIRSPNSHECRNFEPLEGHSLDGKTMPVERGKPQTPNTQIGAKTKESAYMTEDLIQMGSLEDKERARGKGVIHDCQSLTRLSTTIPVSMTVAAHWYGCMYMPAQDARIMRGRDCGASPMDGMPNREWERLQHRRQAGVCHLRVVVPGCESFPHSALN